MCELAYTILWNPITNRFLSVQKANHKRYPNHWDLPGGKREPGEPPAVAALREFKEETGKNLLGIGEERICFFTKIVGWGTDWRAFVQVVELLCPNDRHLFIPEKEMQGYGWFSPAEYMTLPLVTRSSRYILAQASADQLLEGYYQK